MKTSPEEIIRMTRMIPKGCVTNYAELCPEAPRVVGQILRRSEEPDLPWHRVVRADGSLALGSVQRRLLEAEGVPFIGDCVDMETAALPREALVS
jgi:methylated-DNA-protein-cysteine methyltransferase related protein